MNNFLVVANDATDQDDLAAAVAMLERSASVEVRRTSDPSECNDCIAAVDGRRLVIAGGDGTLSHMVGLLRAAGQLSQIELGLLPLGTGNDFARSLGLPLDAAESARIVAEGTLLSVDLIVGSYGGSSEPVIVMNAVHAGVGADAAHASDTIKKALGPVAYPIGALVAGTTATPATIRVRVDDGTVFDGDALMVGIGNGRTIGGGTEMFPQAQIGDGLMDILIVAAESIAEKIGFVRALREGAPDNSNEVFSTQGRSISITGEPLRYDADGELSDDYTRSEFSIEPAAWRIMGPGRC